MVKNVVEKLDYYESIIHKHEIINNLKDLSQKDNISEIKEKIEDIILL